MDDKTLVELFDEAYCALMAMRTDHPEKIWPTSFVYPDEVRNNAETMREAFEAQATRLEALKAALRGLLGNEVAEERIGWRGSSPSNPDLYQCEYCHKEHCDCTEIEHLGDCPILAARQALAGDDHGHR